MSSGPNSTKIAVVGGGLVGSLLAAFLSKRNYQVEVYERRPDMRVEVVDAGRSINLAISTRGLQAVGKLGLREEVLSQAVAMRGRLIHGRNGQKLLQPYGTDDSECIYSISRGGLNKILMNSAEHSRVRFHFNERLTDASLPEGKLKFKNERSGELCEKVYDLVFGTDGAGSATRQLLGLQAGVLASEALLDYGYKEIIMPAFGQGRYAMEKHALHIWPRGNFMLIALPNLDGSFTCTLFLPFFGSPSFDEIQTPQALNAFFSKFFADAMALLPNLQEEFFSHPTGHMVTVKAFPWHLRGKVLLLGDAAHAIVPFFGQGMNCGFEDVSFLDQILDLAEGEGKPVPWETVFSDFGLLRKPNTDAIAEMAVENFLEMRDKVEDPHFQKKKELENFLQKRFPGKYISRYRLVTFTEVPYQLALEAGKIQDALLEELAVSGKSPEEFDSAMIERLLDSRLVPLLQAASKARVPTLS